MSRLDVKVRLSDGVHDAELVKSGPKRSWVKLASDKKVIKIRNNRLTMGVTLNDVRILGPDGALARVVPPRPSSPPSRTARSAVDVPLRRRG
jgi:hypothetical protein